MSLSVPQIVPYGKMTDHLTLPQLESIIPAHVVQDVLSQCEAWEHREKKLNMQAMVYLIIALALYPQCSTREVYRRLLEGLPQEARQAEDVPTAGALCQRRQQLAVTPMRTLFSRIARRIAVPQTRSAFGFGLRLLAVDATMENLPDTDANRCVFPYHTQEELSRSPFPQARCVSLMECGTHVIFDTQITTVKQGEISSVIALIERSLSADMLRLCDAGICCSQVLMAARHKDAHVIGRLDSTSYKRPWVRLHDGSYLVKVYRDSNHQSGHVLTARVIEYRIKHPQTGDLSDPIRLMTTLLDPKQYPTHAIIRVYHERWEIELSFDEIKTHLSLSARTLRSQTPAGVEQELYGVLLASFAVRTLMYIAALQADWDPDEVSFVQTVNVLQRSQWRLMQASCWQRPALREALLQEVRQERVPPRRLRFQARVVKRTRSRYERKWYAHLRAPCLKESFLDLVVLLISMVLGCPHKVLSLLSRRQRRRVKGVKRVCGDTPPPGRGASPPCTLAFANFCAQKLGMTHVGSTNRLLRPSKKLPEPLLKAPLRIFFFFHPQSILDRKNIQLLV